MSGGLSLSNIYQKILVILSGLILVSLSKYSSQMPTSATSQQNQGLVSFVPYQCCSVPNQFQRRRGTGGGGRGVSFNRFSMIGSFLAK